MRTASLAPMGLLIAALAMLMGCHKGYEGFWGGDASSRQGRYLGVGIYSPGSAWSRLVAAQPTIAPQAQRADDQAIIVVTDSQTGEVRACGDLTGYCIGMNPWRSVLAKDQLTPVEVTPLPAATARKSDSDAAPSAEK